MRFRRVLFLSVISAFSGGNYGYASDTNFETMFSPHYDFCSQNRYIWEAKLRIFTSVSFMLLFSGATALYLSTPNTRHHADQ